MTIEVPAETAVIAPDAAPTVATAVEPLIHTPAEVELVSVPDSPTQKTDVPVIAEGSGLTVNTAVRTQPELDV